MDNSGKIYSLLDQASFNDWLTQFFNKKSNELAYSRQNQPKRMEKLVLNLATANTEGYKVPVPFKSCVISRVYSTSTGIDKAGSIRILFDQPNLGNLNNAVNLFVNDTLKSETLFTESYLLWPAQSDTSVEMYFFPDLEISTGTTKTQIVGTVPISNATSSPTATFQFNVNGASLTNPYTVPAQRYAVLKITASNSGGTGQNLISVNGNTVFFTLGTTSTSPYGVSQEIVLKANDVITQILASTVTANLSVYIEEYTII